MLMLNLRFVLRNNKELQKYSVVIVWVPDIFIRRLKQTLKSKTPVMWSLMCPHECPGLTDKLV
ncbi:hypothetical protein L917_14096 [Phytophthora nicotianae]|uniref:Uncharacterized protein n=1 Tax=Phytophthora nicotianae TaxID=4792 RepID=W2KMN2_PHYNI|nr:hypothetical protein L917_14096 [Phytophthora nicotianae]